LLKTSHGVSIVIPSLVLIAPAYVSKPKQKSCGMRVQLLGIVMEESIDMLAGPRMTLERAMSQSLKEDCVLLVTSTAILQLASWHNMELPGGGGQFGHCARPI